jgi:hypothetical protein
MAESDGHRGRSGDKEACFEAARLAAFIRDENSAVSFYSALWAFVPRAAGSSSFGYKGMSGVICGICRQSIS